MRDLTKEELKLSPDWATHYFIDVDDDVIYESVSLCWWKSLDNPMKNYTFNMRKNKAINWKPFDISEYQSPSMREIDQPYIDCVDSELLIVIGKVDKGWAIAIAKALGVTAKDLI